MSVWTWYRVVSPEMESRWGRQSSSRVLAEEMPKRQNLKSGPRSSVLDACDVLCSFKPSQVQGNSSLLLLNDARTRTSQPQPSLVEVSVCPLTCHGFRRWFVRRSVRSGRELHSTASNFVAPTTHTHF